MVWEQQGESVLRRLAIEDPGKLATIAYGLLPRDVFISVEHRTPGNMDPEDWAIMARLVSIVRECLPPGANAVPADVAGVIEDGLRSHFAKDLPQLIEVKTDEAVAMTVANEEPRDARD
ncbi:hypothetical protein [Bradyrhizobium jicamae]|uniref:hypothetical protein n=1 Tax=Bradyrhizobium jicamae TaxID=280332 RepID=UPI0012ECE42C|nr:hypothetical protein [Bradyrhizobium jicamae]